MTRQEVRGRQHRGERFARLGFVALVTASFMANVLGPIPMAAAADAKAAQSQPAATKPAPAPAAPLAPPPDGIIRPPAPAVGDPSADPGLTPAPDPTATDAPPTTPTDAAPAPAPAPSTGDEAPTGTSAFAVLLPGQWADAAAPGGVAGSVPTMTAGATAGLVVLAADAAGHQVLGGGTVRLTVEDAHAAAQATIPLTAGSGAATVMFPTAGDWTVTVTDPAGRVPAATSAVIHVVAGPAARLLVRLPGQTWEPGTAAGVAGDAGVQTAGMPFDVEVRAADAFGNLVAGSTAVVSLAAGDPGATLPSARALANGSATLRVTLPTAGNWTIRATTTAGLASPAATVTVVPPTQLIIRLKTGAVASAIVAAHGGQIVDAIDALRMVVVRVPAADAASVLAAYRADPLVAGADLDRTRDVSGTVSDPGYADQWNLSRIGWESARANAAPAGSAVIAVLDTGVDAAQPDLSGVVLPGWSAFSGGNAASDPNGHGTAMASIAAAATDNGTGIAGVAYAGVRVLPVQVLDAAGLGLDSDVIAGLIWAADHGATVILMAFSNPGASASLQAAVDYAWSRGIVVVAATGNDGFTTPTYPAGLAHVIGVTGTDRADALLAGANSGADTFLAAPGTAIPAMAPGGSVVSISGTSAAAAQVAGAAALLQAIDPAADPSVIAGRLARTAAPAGSPAQVGNGRLDLARAVADTSTAGVDPAGAPGGGPFVGPYVAALNSCVWIGGTDSTTGKDWATAANWSNCGSGIPGTGDTVTINGSITAGHYYPVIAAGTVPASGSLYNMSIGASGTGASLTVSGGALSIAGLTLSAGATLTQSGGSIATTTGNSTTLSGTATFSGGTFTTYSGASLQVAGTVTISGGAVTANGTPGFTGYNQTSGTLSVNSGSLTLNGPANLSTGTLNINANGTLNLSTGGALTVSNVGFLNLYSSQTITGTLTQTGGTITVESGSPVTTLTVGSGGILSRTGGPMTVSAGAALAIAAGGTLSHTAGALTVSAASAPYAAGSITSNGTATAISGSNLTLNGALNVPAGTATITTFTVGATGSVTVNGGTLTVTNSGTTTVTAGGTVTVSSGAFNATGVAISGTVAVSGTGAFTTSGVSTVPTGGSLSLNGAGASITIPSGGGLTVSGGTLTDTLGTFTVASGGSLAASSGTMAISSPISVSGTYTQSGGAVTIYSGGGMSFATGSTASKVYAGTLTVSAGSTFSIATGAAIQVYGTAILALNESVTVLGTLNQTGGTITVAAATTLAIGSGGTAGSLTKSSSGTLTLSGTLSMVNGSMTQSGGTTTVGGAFLAPTGTTVTATSGTFATVSGAAISVTGGSLTTPALTIVAGATMTISSGTVAASTIRVDGTWTQSAGTTLVTASSPTFWTYGTTNVSGGIIHMAASLATTPAGTNYWYVQPGGTFNLSGTGQVDVYRWSTQAAASPNPAAAINQSGTSLLKVYNNFANGGIFNATGGTLEFAGSGNMSNSYGTNQFYNVQIDSGVTTNFASLTLGISIRGDLTNNGTATLASTSATTVTFNGTGTQTIGGSRAITFRNLIVAKAAGSVMLAQNITMGTTTRTGILTFTQGTIVTGTPTAGVYPYTVIVPNGSSVSVVSGFVEGNLRKTVTTGTNVSRTFEVGTGTTYSPVTVVHASVATAGTLTVSAVAGQHPQIGTSSISTGADVARWWTLTSTTALTSATTASATFTFAASDVTGGDATGFTTQRYAASWSTPTPGTKTSTTNQVVGLTSSTLTASYAIGQLVAAATSNMGAVTVNTPTMVAGSALNSPDFTFSVPVASYFTSGSQVQIVVPAGWTQPQADSAALAGYVTVTAGTCTPDLTPVIAAGTGGDTGGWTITVTMTNGCLQGTSFFITYGADSSTQVTAPQVVTTATFTSRSRAGGSGSPVNLVSTQPTIAVVPDVASKLQVLLPGMSAAPGTSSGYSTGPSTAYAGTQLTVTVNATDQYWNVVSSAAQTVSITSTDAYAFGPGPGYALLPGSVTLAQGTAAFLMTFKTAGSQTVTAAWTSGSPVLSAGTSPSVTVGAGSATKLQILLPGETAAPGSPSGKTGAVTAQNAVTAFNVTVNAVDGYWNKVSSSNPTIAISTNPNTTYTTLPSNASLSSGTGSFAVTIRRAGDWTVTAATSGSPSLTSVESTTVTVTTGPAYQLQVLLPGETAVAGSPTGKTGTPSNGTAGTPVTVTVNAVDANWNIVGTAVPTVRITTTDGNAILPANNSLTTGAQTFAVTFKTASQTAGTHTVTATYVSGTPSVLPGTSAALTVDPGVAEMLQVLLPTETARPGTATGQDGTPYAITVGTTGSPTTVTVTVNAVDHYYNKVSTATQTVSITSTDAQAKIGGAALPQTGALVSGTKQFTVAINTAGTQTITATFSSGSPSLTADTSSSIAVTAGAATRFVFGPVAPATSLTPQTQGVAFSFSVTAKDDFGNTDTAYAGTLRFSSNDGSAVLPGDSTLTAGTGTRTFSATLVTVTLTPTQLVTATALVSGNPTGITGNTGLIKVDAPVGATVSVSLSPASITANATATSIATATVKNQAGVAIAGVSATWTQSAGGDVLLNGLLLPATCTTNSSGQCSITITASKTAGSDNITATYSPGSPAPSVAGSATLTETAGAAVKLQVVLPGMVPLPGSASGNDGTAPTARIAGSAFTVTVNAVDQYWNIVSTSAPTVGFSSTDTNWAQPTGGALVNGTRSFTATFRTAGSWTVSASTSGSPSLASNTSPSVVVGAGDAVKLQVLLPGMLAAPGTSGSATPGYTGTPSAQTAGASVSVVVRAVDANWNLAASTTLVGITSSDPAATPVTPVSDHVLSGGAWTFSITFKTAGQQSVTATDKAGSPTLTAGTSPNLTVTAAAAVTFAVVPSSYTQTAGTPFSLTVTARDVYGNTAKGYTGTVGFTSTDVASTLPSNYAFVALDAGVHVFTSGSSVTFRTAGSRTITATDTVSSAITGTSAAIAVNADVPASIALALSPSSIVANAVQTSTATATVKDAFNNVVSGQTVTITTNGDQAISAVTYAGSGQYTATITASKTATIVPDTITASVTTIVTTYTATATLTETPGPVVKLLITLPGQTYVPGSASGRSGTPTAVVAGASVTATVRAVDSNFNLVSSASPTVAITSSDANAVLPANAALSGGIGTFAVTLKTAGSRTLTATDVAAALTASTSTAVTVNAGTATVLQVLLPGEIARPGTATGKTGTPNPTTAGTSVTAIVNAVDAFWNTDPTATPTVSITSTDGTVASPASVTLAAGTGSTVLPFTLAGSTTVTAARTGGTPSVSPGTSAAIVVDAADATHFSVTATSPQMAGVAFTFTVAARDPYENVDTGYVGTLRFTASAAATLPGDAPLGIGTGTGTFSILFSSAGNVTITATELIDTSPTGISGTSSAITVSTPSGVNVSVALSPTSITADATSETQATATVRTVATPLQATVTFTTDTGGDVTFSADNVTFGSSAQCTSTGGTCSVWIKASKTAGTETIKATASSVTGTVSLTELAGPVAKLQVLLPGQTAAPGTDLGYDVAPSSITAGATVTATVRAVDQYFNLVASANPTVAITTTDSNAVRPANASLSGGTKGFQLTFKTAGSVTVTATDTVPADGIAAGTSASATVVHAAASRYQVLLSGQSPAPGTTLGYDVGPTGINAGQTTQITVRATDAYWNLVTTAAATVQLSSTDPYATAGGTLLTTNTVRVSLVDGVGSPTTTATLVTAGVRSVSAAYYSGASNLTTGTSALITVSPASLAGYQVLLPGETAVPGSASGKTGIPAATVGFAAAAVVRAVDQYFNLVSSTTTVTLTTTYPATTVLPGPAALVAGQGTFNVTFKRAGAQTVTATACTTVVAGVCTVLGSTTGTSSPVTVAAGAAVSLNIILDGQYPAPGTATGHTGTPLDTNAGTSINVHVYAVDAYFNTVTTAVPVVGISASDPTATVEAPNPTALVDGEKVFHLTFRQAGVQTTIAAWTSGPLQTILPDTSEPIHVNPAQANTLSIVPSTTSVTAGTPFTVTVTVFDEFGNIATGYNGTLHFTSDDGAAVLPGSSTLPAGTGTGTFNVTLKTVNTATPFTQTITVGSGALTDASTTGITVNHAGPSNLYLALDKASVLADPNCDHGATGECSATATARVEDAYGNPVGPGGEVPGVTVTFSAEKDATFGSGTVGPWPSIATCETDAAGECAVTVHAGTIAETELIYATAGALLDVALLTETPLAAEKLLVLLPGQDWQPGVEEDPQITGSPDAQVAGAPFTVRVFAVDEYWNQVADAQGTISLAADSADADPDNWQTPAPETLSAGADSFPVTVLQAGTWNFTASDPDYVPEGADPLTDPQVGLAPGTTSPDLAVAPGLPVKLQVLLSIRDSGGVFVSGEQAAPGTATGRTGSLASVAAGDNVTATFRVVDAWWNVVPSQRPHLHITTTDTAYTGQTFDLDPSLDPSCASYPSVNCYPPPWAPGGWVNGSVNVTAPFLTAGAWTVTAEDCTTSSAGSCTGPITSGTSDLVHVEAGPAVSLEVVPVLPWDAGNSRFDTTAGVAFSFTVTAKDAHGNVATGYRGTVTIDVSETDLSAVLLPNPYAFTAADAGVHAFAATLNTASLVQTLTAIGTGTGTPGGESAHIKVSSRTATTISLELDPATMLADPDCTDAGAIKCVGDAIATVLDDGGDPVSGQLVTFSSQVDATFSDPTTDPPDQTPWTTTGTCTTGALGTCTVTVHPGRIAEVEWIKASLATPAISATALLTEVPLPAEKLLVLLPGQTSHPGIEADPQITGSPDAQQAGTPFTVRVFAVDEYWNVVVDTSGTISLAADSGDADAANWQAPAPEPLEAGATAFSVTVWQAGTWDFTASDPDYEPEVIGPPLVEQVGLAPGTTSPGLAVAPGPQVKLQVLLSIRDGGGAFVSGEQAAPGTATGKTGSLPSISAGQDVTATVRIVDAWWNVVTDAIAPEVEVTTTDPHYNPLGVPDIFPLHPAAWTNGTAQLVAPFIIAGAWTVTATWVEEGPSLAAGTSSLVHVEAGAAASLEVVPADDVPVNLVVATAGVSIAIAIRALDGFGNLATTYHGTVDLTTSDTVATLMPESLEFNGRTGVDYTTATFRTVGSGCQTVTATDHDVPALTDTSRCIVVDPGEPAAITLALSSATVTADYASTVTATITITDAFGNTVYEPPEDVALTTTGDVTIGTVTGHELTHYHATITASRTADLETLTATDLDESLSTSATLTEVPGAAVKLLVTIGDETWVPGGVGETEDARKANAGRSGAPDQVAGVAFTAHVWAVDAYWNVVQGAAPKVHFCASTETVPETCGTTDPLAMLPDDDTLAAGHDSFLMSFRTSGETGVHQHVMVWDASETPTLTSGTSSPVHVSPAAPYKLNWEVTIPSTIHGATLAGEPIAEEDTSFILPMLDVEDEFGNDVDVPNGSVSVSLAVRTGTPVEGGIPGRLTGTTTRTAFAQYGEQARLAVFNDLTMRGIGTAYQLSATATGLQAADSNAFDIGQRTITITAVPATKDFDGDTTCPKTAGACQPTTDDSVLQLAAGDVGTWTQTFSSSLPGTDKTLTPTGTIYDPVSQVDVTASYHIVVHEPLPAGTINGTVIYAPAAIDIGSGFPGQTVTSEVATVGWISTDITNNLSVSLGVNGLGDGASNYIDTEDVLLLTTTDGTDTVVGDFSAARVVASYPLASNTRDSQQFRIRVNVPAAPAGWYAGTLTFELTTH